MSAKIIGLEGIDWSAQAALADAMQRIPDDAKVIVAWHDLDGAFHWSQSGCNRKDVCWIASVLQADSMHTNNGDYLHSGDEPPKQ